VAFLAGAAMAVLAAVFGMFDFSGVPRGTPARRSGWIHAALNIPSTVLFAAAGAMLYFGDTGRVPLVLASVAFVATGAAGWFGWKLVQTHHVGVDDRPKAQREPSASARPVEHGMVGR
jgi:uncharacterized membrane protein